MSAILLLALAVTGVGLVFSWVSTERDRAVRGWQDKLAIVAESRAAAVGDWLQSQREVVASLGRDDVLRLYVSDISALAPDRVADDVPVQAQFLENLLVVTAARTGFNAAAVGPDVRANVARVGRAGLALLDPNLEIIVATPDLPPLTPALRAFVAGQAAADGPAMFGPFPSPADGTASLLFTAPIPGVQDDRQIGLVVGIRPVAMPLFGLLKQPGTTEETAETLLLTAEGAGVRYLSPLADGTAAMTRTRALNTPALAAAFAIQNTGGFGLYHDYRDVPVLIASRPVPGVDWVLAYKVDREEALGGADRRLTRLALILLLAIGLAALGIVAAWRHGASRRAESAATRYRDMADRFEQQAKFIRKLTDTQPNAIFIVDRNDRLTFANARLAQTIGAHDTDELVGKTLTGVFGPAAARRYARYVRDAFDEECNLLSVDRVEGSERTGQAGEDRVLQNQFVHLPATDHVGAGILIVEQDISAAISERERNERLLQQLAETLLAVVDRRDSFAAHQSARVAQVAAAIADEMGLDAVLVDTVDKAASVMNIGKILVPRALLMKNGKLTDDEIERIRHALAAGVDLLEGVEFEGPVVETLRQTRAHVDGNGEPAGLAGDEILVTARIVAVANAFVGMVSPRAHRPGLTFDAAVQNLLDGAGTQFDLRVVAALINRLDNHGGRSNWSNFSVPPPGIRGVVG
ncbi:MAG: HD domain-containing phosphohydrolase [Alphaproteobacteria bacterium]